MLMTESQFEGAVQGRVEGVRETRADQVHGTSQPHPPNTEEEG